MTAVLCLALTAMVALSVSASRKVSSISAADVLTVSPFETNGDPLVFDYKIIKELPHDHTAFTQGLQFEKHCTGDNAEYCRDVFWESTGLYGESTVRQVEVMTGKVLNSRKLDDKFFGEGLAKIEDRIYQLTWQVPTVFVYDELLTPVDEKETELSDGWGLTTDGESLIATDSGSSLYFIDPESFKTKREVTVRDDDHEIPELNELEWIDGKVYANVWYSNCLAVIEPEGGQVTAWVVLTGLSDIAAAAMPPGSRIDVLNGIAYDAEHGRLFVTGKLWPRVFEIELVQRHDVSADELAKVRKTCRPRTQG